MAKMTNQKFCYWLQGYFEIADSPSLSESRCKDIENMLTQIKEPFGPFTSWLNETLESVRLNAYHQPIIDLFTQPIQNALNGVFYHVIDPKYDGPVSLEDLLKIHEGQVVEGAGYDQ